jgi:uncharacterized Rmd1/YagE family protein
MKRCTSTCIAKNIDLDQLQQQLETAANGTRYRDALHLALADGHLFIFSYGVIVQWGLPDQVLAEINNQVNAFCCGLHERPLQDNFTFEIGAAENRIRGDHIGIMGKEPLELLALSHGLAQSSKLEEFEEYAAQTIEENAQIPRSIAETGRTRLSRKTLARMRGRLFLAQSDINLNYPLLDTPEFFWEYPELEGLYNLTARYLDVHSRIEVLNRKLAIIHALFGMLADELKHEHSSLLEWIIIWLIAIEIVIFVFEILSG